MVSRFDSTFARTVAPAMAAHFGEGKESVEYRLPDGTTTKLSHVVVASERRNWRKDRNGFVLVLSREGWLIADPNRANYSGIESLQIGATLMIDGLAYTIEASTRSHHLADFKAIRTAEAEISSPDFRGR